LICLFGADFGIRLDENARICQSKGGTASQPHKPGNLFPAGTTAQVPNKQVAEEPLSLPIVQVLCTQIIMPEPPKVEIPLYIKELEEKLNNMKRPLSVITQSPGEKITDPEKFIQSHLATIKANIGNPTFEPFIIRLNSYIAMVYT